MAHYSIISSQSGAATLWTGAPKYVGAYLKPGYLEFPAIGSPTAIGWHVGDYVVYSRTGKTYRLYRTPQAAEQGIASKYGASFLYENVQFFDDSKQLEFCPFTDLVPGDNTVHFSTQNTVSFFGKPANVAERIQACLEAQYGAGSWEIRIVTTTDTDLLEILNTEIEFSVTGANCLDVLDKVYDEWGGLGWIHTVENGKNIITIGASNVRTAANTTVPFAFDNGLVRVQRSIANADQIGTRLFAYGSMKNMDATYYRGLDIYHAESVDIEHLMIPLSSWGITDGKPDARKAFIQDAAAIASLGLIPRTAYFDGSGDLPDIHPTIERMTIGEVYDAGGAGYIPDLSKWDRDDRIDEIVAATNPTDHGTSAEQGQKYSEIISSHLDTVSASNQEGQIDEKIWEGTTTKAGRLTLKLGSNNQTFTMMSGWTNPEFSGLQMEVLINGTERAYFPLEVVSSGAPTWTVKLPETVTIKDAPAGTIAIYVFGYVLRNQYDTYANARTYTFSTDATTPVSVKVEYEIAKTFVVRIPQIGFDIDDYADLGNGKTVSMKTGMCAGRDFQVKDAAYVASADAWDLTLYRSIDEDLNIMFPNADYQIAAGDQYVLLDIAMPEMYVTVASSRLLAAAQKLLADICVEKPFYAPQIDAKVVYNEGRVLRDGMWMDITQEGHQEYVMIDSITIDENGSSIPTYEVSLREKKGLDWTENIGKSSSSRSSQSVAGRDASDTSGSVTSVGIEVPEGMWVEGSPVTSKGTIRISLSDGYFIPQTEDFDGIREAFQSLQSQLDSVASRNMFDELKATSFFSDVAAFTNAYAERYYLTDGVYFYVEKVNGIACVHLNAPFITDGDQILGDGTPGGGTPTGVSYLHELLDVNISNPTNGQILAYNSTLQKWVNADAPEDSVQKVAGVSPDANGDIPAANLKTALGLGSAAYKDTSYFAAASHTHSISEVSGLDANLTTISGALQSLQAQIDSVASRDCFGELTATAVTADRAVASEMYAERYYLTNGLYFYVDIVDGVACVHLNAPFITDGDQILGDGTPGGGGGTGATYLWQLDDVDVPSVAGQIIDGQALVWDAASSKWKNRNITQGTVTRVDVGSTQYSPENGVVSLPAYPTTLPASDVYAWAKASTKPSYSLTEITGTADLQAIEALSGTSGLLRKTAANTWELDTNSYVTSSGVTSITAGTGLSGGTITGTGTIAISSTYQDYIAHGESAYNSLSTVSTMLQSLQSQIDAVASRDMFEELSASAFSASVAAVSELRAGYAYAERYYLTDDVYFTAETVDGVVCVKLNSPFITTGDQILGSGGPSGGGGGGDISYLYELTDVDDNLNAPASGTILQWYSNKWVGTAFTSIANGDLLTYASGKWTNVPRTSVGIVTDATTSAHGLMSAADKTKLDGINTTYISHGQTAYENLTTVSAMLQSLQAQVDSVASRDMYEELGATAFFADVAGIGSLIADNIELGGESLKAIPNSYLANHSISINGSTVNLGGSFSTASITAGTAGTSSATSGASISIPYVTMNAYGIVTAYGTHTHSVSLANLVGSSAVGSASLPVYYNGSALIACTGSSLFSDMSSGPSTNLSVTVAGQTRTATLYATYDSASENISDKFGIVSGALQSLQKQIDSVASRSDISDFEATTEAKFDYVCDLMRSLQSQIDSVASRTADVSANGYFDVISVGRAIYGDVLITSDDQTISSDEALKMNLEDIRLSAKDIAGVRAVTFDWKDGRGRSFGTIAQDWLGILPEAVFGEEGNYSVAYAQAAMVAAVINSREIVEIEKHETEQDKEIRGLKAALGKANGRIADLEKEVERLRMN